MTLSLRVSEVARLPLGDLSSREVDLLCERFSHENPEFDRRVKRDRPVGDLEPVIFAYRFEGGEFCLERGAARWLPSVLPDREVVWIDETVSVAADWPEYVGSLRKYQRKAAGALWLARTSILLGPCGCGKTEILLAAAARTGQRTLVVVDEKNLQRQWVERFDLRYPTENRNAVGVIGGIANEAEFRDREGVGDVITVASAQTLKNRLDLLDEFGCFVADEVHVWAASTFEEIAKRCPARWRIGGTATLQRTDGRVQVIRDTFGEVVYEVTETQLEAAGVRQEVDVVLVPTGFKFGSPTSRRGGGRRTPWHAIEAAMIGDTDRHSLAVSTCFRAAVEGPLLILCKRRDYAVEIAAELRERYGIPVHSLFGGTRRPSDCVACGYFPSVEKNSRVCPRCGAKYLSRSDHNAAVIEGVNNGRIRAAIATTIADKALDLPAVSRAVAVLPTAGGKGQPISARFKQQRGRLSRPADGKGDSVFYYLADVLTGWGEDRARRLRTEVGARLV